MHHRLAAGDRDNRGAEVGQLVETTLDDREIDRFRGVIVFVAIATGEIATAHRNEVGQHRMASRQQRARDKAGFTHLQF